MHRGASNSSRTAVLTAGLKPVELGGNNQEAQFLEARRFQVEEVCRLYRVPPHLVGDLTRSSFSNIEQQSIDFVQHTLLPWLRRFETSIARDLISDRQYFAEFDTRGLLRGDAAARASYYQTLWNLGVASINEIRRWENLDPVDGGDTRFVQLNMQTLDQANAGGVVLEEPQPQAVPEEQERAAPDSISVGDFVSWGSGTGRGRGKITRIVRDGEINVPDSSFTITGTEDDPAVLITVYEELADGWVPTSVRVGHKASTLTKIGALS